jgi:hypothetical protein
VRNSEKECGISHLQGTTIVVGKTMCLVVKIMCLVIKIIRHLVELIITSVGTARLMLLQGANLNVHGPRALPWTGCLLVF